MVIPAYNEERRIGHSLELIKEYMQRSGYNYEIVVVDDGSRDATSQIVSNISQDNPRIRLIINETNRGKGYTVRRGVLEAAGDAILFSDADLSTPIEEFEKLLGYLDDFDIVIASRSLPDSQVLVHQPLYRELMGRTFNALVQAMLVRGIIDTQCGFKLMRGNAARCIFQKARINSFSFDVEMILIAKRMGYRVKDVPVRWIDSRGSRVHPIKDSAHMLLDLFRIKLYDFLGYYGR